MVALLAGCATSKKEYIEPEGGYGDDCISACNVVRTECRARGQDYHRQCREQYDYQMRQFNFCRQQGGRFCVKPERCRPPELKICSDQYDGCFLSCGGRIEVTDPEAGR